MQLIEELIRGIGNALGAAINNFTSPPPVAYGPGTNVLGINWDFWGPGCLIIVFLLLTVMRHIQGKGKK